MVRQALTYNSKLKKMKYCHTILLSAFVMPEDNEEKIKKTIKSFLDIDWEKESTLLNHVKAEGFNNREIIIYEMKLIKEKHTRLFIEHLLSKLTQDQKDFLTTDKQNRLDENNDFFIRLDMENLLKGVYQITTSGTCFHIKMTIAAFPKNRENALKVIDDMLKQ